MILAKDGHNIIKLPIFEYQIVNINIKLTNGMSSQVFNLIAGTINPSLLQSSRIQIDRTRGNQGFAVQLLMIGDDTNNDIKIRQSALIVLKNLVYDERIMGGVMNKNDYHIIKGSILDALTRQSGNKYLTTIIREIIHLIAEIDYPERWPQILPAIIDNIQNGTDFATVSSSIQALKAITSSCNKSLNQSITISNLCNKIVVPLFQLANKLFANYTPQTLPILISIFKVFNLCIFYHLPPIIINNIHSLMIFCKKILQISAQDMIPLKIICLKIVSRLYSRHLGGNVSYNLLQFAQDFNKRYSPLMVETFTYQLMDQSNSPQVYNLSLNCLTCIYKNDEKSSQIIDQHRRKILQCCLLRYKLKKLKQGQSIGLFITHIKQQRNHFIDFIVAIFCAHEQLLGELIEYLNKGDQTIQEIVLYIFMSLSQQVETRPQLYQNMSQFIITYILPILSGNSSYIMKARGCEIITVYKFIELPSENLQQFFKFIYSCLTQSKQCYLNIFALEAFTQLICKYDEFMKLIIPYLENILKVYTNLLKQSHGQVYQVIKSFELFLGLLDGKNIENCAADLVKFLTNLFYQFLQQKQTNPNTNNAQQDDQQSDDEDDNPCHARQGCLACIRQIIGVQNLPANFYSQIIDECILQLAVSILLDKNLLHFEQCLNILNLCLYRGKDLPSNFNQFFKIFTYAIIGIPNQLESVNLQPQYQEILKNVCINPDQDLVSNVIGFFKNFIAKSTNQLRDLKDQIGVTFIEYLYKMVEYVHISRKQNGQFKFKKSERAVILTIYGSLLQQQFLNNNQYELIVNNLMSWYSSQQNATKGETNIYIEMLLICQFYNPQITSQKLNSEQFVNQLLQRFGLFNQQYQLQRLLLGVCKMIQNKLLTNQQSARQLMGLIPNLVFKLISQRIKQAQNKQAEPIDLQQEAEEDLIAENTHLGTFPLKHQDSQKEKQLNAMQQVQWDEEYNKYYISPFHNINELEYLTNVLKNSPYTNLMSNQDQQKLTQYICNAPKKHIV